MLVPDTAVQQQDGHVDDVEIGQKVPYATCYAVCQWTQQVAGVVKVTCSPPEARSEQLAFMDAAIYWTIRALDKSRLAAPYFAFTLRPAEQVLLMVGGAEDVVAHQAECEDGPGIRGGELDWVVDQVQTLKQRDKRKNWEILKIPTLACVSFFHPADYKLLHLTY